MGVVAWLRTKLSAARERTPIDPSRAAAAAFYDHATRHSWDRDAYPQRCARCDEVRTFDTEDKLCSRGT